MNPVKGSTETKHVLIGRNYIYSSEFGVKYESGNMHEYLQYFFNFKGWITYPKKQETKSCFITSKTYFILKKYIYSFFLPIF